MANLVVLVQWQNSSESHDSDSDGFVVLFILVNLVILVYMVILVNPVILVKMVIFMNLVNLTNMSMMILVIM